MEAFLCSEVCYCMRKNAYLRVMKRILIFLVILGYSCHIISADTYQYKQYSPLNRLSYQYITALSSDSFGRLWIGTSNGVNLLSNGHVKAYTQILYDGTNIPVDRIYSIVSDDTILVASDMELLRFDEKAGSFTPVRRNGMAIISSALADVDDYALIFDSQNNALLSYEYETGEISFVQEFDPGVVSSVKKMLRPQNSKDIIILADGNHGIFEYSLATHHLKHIDNIPDTITANATFIDSHNNLWVSPFYGGVICYDSSRSYSQQIVYNRAHSSMSDDAVLSIAESNGKIWISTDGGGINIIDTETGAVEIFQNPLLMSSTVLLKGFDEEIFAGTTHYGLICVKDNFIVTLYDEYMRGTQPTLSSSVVQSIYEDPGYGIWLGTDGGGLNLFDEKNGTITSIASSYGRKVNFICPYDENHLLLMLYNEGLTLFDKRSHTISPFHIKNMPEMDFSNTRINFTRPFSDQNGNIFFFNWGNNNYYLNSDRSSFVSFFSSLSEGQLTLITNFRANSNYSIATSRSAFFEINNTTLAVREIYKAPSPVNDSCISQKGDIWFADAEGLGSFSTSTGVVSRYDVIDDPSISLSIAVGTDDRVWIAQNGGILICFNPLTNTKQIFTEADGVQEQHFSRRATFTSSSGNIFIPGSSGLTIIFPDKMRPKNNSTGKVSLLSVFVDDVPLEKDIYKVVKVPNKFTSVKIRISGNTAEPSVKTKFRYGVAGRIDEDFVESTEEEYVFQRHPTGKYSVTVSMLTQSGWTESRPILDIVVQKSFWVRYYMLLLYVLLLLGIIIVISARREWRIKNEAETKMRETEKKQIEDKVVFMTNIAHELRTPLSLIYNPIKRMMEEENISKKSQDSLIQVTHQVTRMTQMINMVLDVQKMEITNSSLLVEPVAVNQWVKNLSEEFEIECEEKGLVLSFDLDPDIADINFDRSKIEVALSNLIMNAIKYSDSGTITVCTSMPSDRLLRISVRDQGRGFTGPADALFQRFYQSDSSNVGYGIGLSYAKMLVEKHGGVIGALHNEDIGSTFFIDLPTTLETEGELAEYRLSSDMNSMKESFVNDDFQTDNQTLLIVDNQSNILRYLKSEYQGLFKHIYTAENGQEALDIIRYQLPSIVVSDVMMPVMNGFELCKAIKSDIKISHIPVILLTARDDSENQEMGYKLGADCFVPKPFDVKMLYFIIRNQLKNRAEIKRQYATVVFQNSTQDLTFSLADEKFILKINKFILDNISDPDLDIDMVIDHMCMSRTTLFYKMNTLTGMPTSKYIRKLRIDKAKDLLENTDTPINDISSKLGFSESRYFSTVFKQETGETPSQYKKRVRGAGSDA